MSRIGILAGGGGLPVAVAESVLRSGREVYLVGIDNEADKAIERFPHTWSNLGGVGRIVHAFRANDCRELVIVGSTSRPDLMKLRPDLGFFSNLIPLTRLLFGGDNSILSGVVGFFEAKGFIVRGAHELAPDLVAGDGNLGIIEPGSQDETDIVRGLAVISALGPLDVGQAVIVAGGKVLAIEGAEGTDRMLERCRGLRQLPRAGTGGRTGVLVKRPKPGQEIRVDMPTIGPRTVEMAVTAQLAGLAIQSGHVLMAEREQLIALADSQHMFVRGVSLPVADVVGASMPGREVLSVPLRKLGRRSPSRRDRTDSAKGTHVLAAMRKFGTGQAVVVARDYVVAVAAAETTVGMLERCASLRQWGARSASHRVGVLVWHVDRDDAANAGQSALSDSLLAGAAAAGLAGIVLLGASFDIEAPDRQLLAKIYSHGLFLAAGPATLIPQN